MARRFVMMPAVLLSLLISVVALSPAQADVAPPWCGEPVPDAAENLPDGTDPADPAGQLSAHPVVRDRLHARRSSPRAATAGWRST